MRRRGFTFVEVTAAVAIGAFVTLVAMGALKSISDGSRTVNEHSEMTAEMRFVTELIRSDLINFYRDPQQQNNKMRGGVQMTGLAEQGSLTFYTVLHNKTRAGAPEADVYEVEYSMIENGDKQLFTRRVWPNPDKERDPGGVMTILSEHIADFRVRFMTEQEWVAQWSEEENRKLPDMIEVQIVGRWSDRHRPLMRSVIINFVQNNGEMEMLEAVNTSDE